MSERAPSRATLALKYVLLVGVPIGALAFILRAGAVMHGGAASPALPTSVGSSGAIPPSMPDVALLIAQVLVILVAARVTGLLVRQIGQPQVIGEMIAGMALGPSLLGWLLPSVSASLFPAGSLGFLGSLSQIGLLVFMFLVGLELDPKLLRGRGQMAVVTSHASIVAPFLLGAGIAIPLYRAFAPPGVGFAPFALFMGAAMSVTAFPVLARILSERGLTHTRLGSIAIACAAIDDVTAWCILAGVIALVRSGTDGLPLWMTLGGSVVYVAIMFGIVRPLLRSLTGVVARRGKLTQDISALVILGMLASALITEKLGIHALFGAFLLGAMMPKEQGFARAFLDRYEDGVVVLLLPLFFAFTGLRTSIALLESSAHWGALALIVTVAVVGKLGGAAVAARWTGMPWRESLALGALMNTRGLMELVILNVGLDIGVLSRPLFTMMVMMALVTTFMTTPLLAWLHPSPVHVDVPRGLSPAGH